ncbi:hypothetical protein [Epibacterium ulvae]|uniref:hypothetical protein n=1 Tax=Epibacterium ulvae TaxID=1156985 RepID=UPI002493A21E|nr:hypothetical protein [Epibacterium ulvae]
MKAPEINGTASSQPRADGPEASPDRLTRTRKRAPSSTPADGAKQTSAIFGEAATQTENTQRRGSSRPHQEDRPTSRVPTILKAAAVLGGAYYIANTRHRVEQKAIATQSANQFVPKAQWKDTALGDGVQALYDAPHAGKPSQQKRIDRAVDEVKGQGKPFHTVTPTYRESDKANHVRVLTPDARKKATVTAQNGNLVDYKDRPLKPGRYMYVIDMNKNLIASPVRVGTLLHHSSLAGSEPVITAGEFDVGKGGKLKMMNNFSGHHQTSKPSLDRGVEALVERGFDMKDVQLIKHPQSHQTHPPQNF